MARLLGTLAWFIFAIAGFMLTRTTRPESKRDTSEASMPGCPVTWSRKVIPFVLGLVRSTYERQPTTRNGIQASSTARRENQFTPQTWFVVFLRYPTRAGKGGFTMFKGKLLSVGADAKTKKGTKHNYLTGILYLAPANEAGRGNLCPHASMGCRSACLFSAGRGKFSNVRTARVNKTLRWFDDRRAFLADLVRDIGKLESYCKRHGFRPAVRLNGTSDIPWENVILPDEGCSLMALFPGVKFYDYTKNKYRALKAARQNHPSVNPTSKRVWPENYSLTFSRSESNKRECAQVLRAGGNVAAVYSKDLFDRFQWDRRGLSYHGKTGKGKPHFGQTYLTFNGDDTDLRFLDPSGVVVALRAKGDAKGDTSGFVIN